MLSILRVNTILTREKDVTPASYVHSVCTSKQGRERFLVTSATTLYSGAVNQLTQVTTRREVLLPIESLQRVHTRVDRCSTWLCQTT